MNIPYFGHIKRKNNLLSTAVEGRVKGRRPRGRPRNTWFTDVKVSTGLPGHEITRMAAQRDLWGVISRQPSSRRWHPQVNPGEYSIYVNTTEMSEWDSIIPMFSEHSKLDSKPGETKMVAKTKFSFENRKNNFFVCGRANMMRAEDSKHNFKFRWPKISVVFFLCIYRPPLATGQLSKKSHHYPVSWLLKKYSINDKIDFCMVIWEMIVTRLGEKFIMK